MRLVDSPMTLVLAAIGAPVRIVALSCAAIGIASRGMMHATPLAVSASWNATRAVMRTPTDRDTGERCMSRIEQYPGRPSRSNGPLPAREALPGWARHSTLEPWAPVLLQCLGVRREKPILPASQ